MSTVMSAVPSPVPAAPPRRRFRGSRLLAGAALAGLLALAGTPSALAQTTAPQTTAPQSTGPQPPPALSGPVTLIHAGTLLAVPGEKPVTQQTIVVRDGKVAEIRAGFAQPADIQTPDAQVVDLRDAFVLPGLIDSHVHIIFELGPDSQLRSVTDDPERSILDGTVFAERTLMAGFTTVRDVGSSARTGVALRDAIAAGKVRGPTLLVAGQGLAVTAGHGDINGFNEKVTEALSDSRINVCDGSDTCRQAVREQVRRGADLIKLSATGGVLSQIAAGTGQQMFDDELRSIVETAHLMGRKVAAHAHAADGINAALRAGVDSVEHGSYLDDESIRLFRQTGAYLVPTLLAGKTVVDMANRPGVMSPAVKRKALTVGPMMQRNFARAAKAEVKIAFGTDSGVSAHGINAQEFKLMVEAGLSPMDAIRAATVNAADLLGIADRAGSLEPGKDADIIAVSGSPLENVTALETVDFVMRRGAVHKMDGRRTPFEPKG
ncbi:metal-dependent hydrolase family protein [Rhodocista pekingensis]|uniref:Amidohydrolase family protein n=1 Tax=Rhodocista pekingensis TaxID=201185 RepID=A0ABW2KQS6_9PROT